MECFYNVSDFELSFRGNWYPVRKTSAGEALSYCFNLPGDWKLLDRDHPDGDFIELLQQADIRYAFLWVMRRNSNETDLGLCPIVIVDVMKNSVSRGVLPCSEGAFAVCEPRSEFVSSISSSESRYLNE